MKKLIMLVALFTAATFSASAQLLYKISGKGLKAPSYIVGTYHVAPHSFTDSIPGLKNVYDEVKQVYGEVVSTEMLKPENLSRMQKAMSLPEGQTLYTIYTEEEIKEIDAIVQNVMGLSMKNPMVEQQLIKLSPQTLNLQLNLLMAIKMNPKLDISKPIDISLQNMAKERGLKIGGLESFESQMNILYNVPLEKGKKSLLCMVRNFEATKAQAERIQNCYMKRDIKGLEEAMNEKFDNECDPSEKDMDVLIYNRNKAWLEIMPGIMNEAPTLFAVGAGHLVNDRGVLTLLKNAGYTVEAVDVVKKNCCK